jgi:hypothetical protein
MPLWVDNVRLAVWNVKYTPGISMMVHGLCGPLCDPRAGRRPQREYSGCEGWASRDGPPSGCGMADKLQDLPPWYMVSQQCLRWRKAGGWAALMQDLRVGLRLAHGLTAPPLTGIVDRRTRPAPPERRMQAMAVPHADGREGAQGGRDPGPLVGRARDTRQGAGSHARLCVAAPAWGGDT